ncbi:hypothetical protein PJP08_29460, partial [Mycobacterium kansasii]
METRGKKKSTRGPSSSRSTPITKRHLRLPQDDPNDVGNLRDRKVIVERPVNLDHIAPFDILPLLESVGWTNILHWGGPAYQS